MCIRMCSNPVECSCVVIALVGHGRPKRHPRKASKEMSIQEGAGKHRRITRELSESALLQKWPNYLNLQIELAATRDAENGMAGKGVSA
eukprot:5836466-Karenia_brevis.AAC.1